MLYLSLRTTPLRGAVLTSNLSAKAHPSRRAYGRGCAEERLLVTLNPYREAVTFPYDRALGEAVYTFGGAAAQSSGAVTTTPVSAGI